MSNRIVGSALVACLLAATSPSAGADGTATVVVHEHSAVINGAPVAEFARTPWLAVLLDGTEPDPFQAAFCAGTVITPSHVLTAAHCITDSGVTDIEVATGVHDLDAITDADRLETVVPAVVHPDYAGDVDDVDLAILTLTTPIADAIPLTIRPEPPDLGQKVLVLGWGAVEIDESGPLYPYDLRVGAMAIQTDTSSTTNCGFPLSEGAVDHSHQFCYDDPTFSACFGDSGGPVVTGDGINAERRLWLVGIVSQGPSVCNTPGSFDIAERAHSSLPWMQSVTGQTLTGAPVCLWNPETTGQPAATAWTIPCWSTPGSPTLLPFTDVADGQYYTEAVRWLSRNDITQGTSPTTYSPADPVTRGQLAAFLWRFVASPSTSPTTFADVTAAWQLEPVGWLQATGVTTGTSPTTYSPDEPVTRSQLVTFLWRLMDSPTPSSLVSFNDVPAGAYYEAAVAWALQTGITTGTSPDTFAPDETVSRAQMATFLLRLATLVRG